jgi:hypothetical protein
MDLDEVSVKISDGPPDDAEQDLTGPAWAGLVPLTTAFGPANAADDLAPGIEIPASIHRLIQQR